MGQTQLEPVFTDLPFSHTNSYSSKWEVVENNNGTLNNSAVATLRKQGSAANESLNFNERYASFGSAIIRFKTCQAVGKTFSVFWTTYNWGGARQNLGSFQVTVLPPPQGQLKPIIAFSSINGACNQVTLCVINPFPDATFAWNNAMNGSFVGAGVCAAFNAPPPAQVQVVTTCGIGTGSVASTTQAPPLPPFTPEVSINEGPSTVICASEGITLNATSRTCVNNPNNWTWSSTGGSISNQSVLSGSTASAFFNASPGFYTVTIQTIDFLGNPATGNIDILVLSNSDPRCNNPALKKAAEKPQVSLNNERRIEDSNTEGV